MNAMPTTPRHQTDTRLSFADAAIVGAARSRAADRILSFDAEFRKIGDIRINPE
jgi:predicted nucleic acid-binding protein